MPFDTSFLNTIITETKLEAIRYAVQHRIDTTMLREHTCADVFLDQMGRHLVMQLESTFYGSRPDRYEERTEVPADWWSHFKVWALARYVHGANIGWTGRLLGRLMKRLAKPCMREIVFTAEGHLLFPDIPYSTREHFKTIMVADTHLGWGE